MIDKERIEELEADVYRLKLELKAAIEVIYEQCKPSIAPLSKDDITKEIQKKIDEYKRGK